MKDRWLRRERGERPLLCPNERLPVSTRRLVSRALAVRRQSHLVSEKRHILRFYAIPAAAAPIQHRPADFAITPSVMPPFRCSKKIRRGLAAHPCAVAKTRGAGAELAPSTGRATAEFKTRGNAAAVQKRALVGPPCSACCELNSPSDPDSADLFTATVTAAAGRAMTKTDSSRADRGVVQWRNPPLTGRPLQTNTQNGGC
ncbi:uncharacterized protein B0H64DRAFT_98212 [Chaetomium fimeti]|uniref:Uncharacterized protein n=1 Tax=Chaetomium fimeti TaxID=1854472 RepID=A0AAE0LVP5_9PEZI|nr:hypothetical protein B0H64DRAFT_98212 [Chaetomium fimeti]